MTSERDPRDRHDEPEDPTEELKQGLGHLWRAARGMAKGIKKEVDKSDLGKAFDDAGRELARAATNVVGRINDEINKKPRSGPFPGGDEKGGGGREWRGRDDEQDRDHDRKPPHADEDDDFDGVKVKPKDDAPPHESNASRPDEPGFRILIDEPDKKKPE